MKILGTEATPRFALSGLQVHARGEVRYSIPGVGVGVQFIDIAENAIHSIEREIQLSRRI